MAERRRRAAQPPAADGAAPPLPLVELACGMGGAREATAQAACGEGPEVCVTSTRPRSHNAAAGRSRRAYTRATARLNPAAAATTAPHARANVADVTSKIFLTAQCCSACRPRLYRHRNHALHELGADTLFCAFRTFSLNSGR